MLLAAIEPVERFAANEFAFVDQNGILAVFSNRGSQLGYEARLGFKPPRFGNPHIEEGFMIRNDDATRAALFIDAEHLNNKPFFVLVVFCQTTGTTTATATATAATTVCARHLIAHLKIE